MKLAHREQVSAEVRQQGAGPPIVAKVPVMQLLGDLGKAVESGQRGKIPILGQLEYQAWVQVSYTNYA